MNEVKEGLGIIRLIADGAEFTKTEERIGKDWACFRVATYPGGPADQVLIVDGRSETLAAAKIAQDISTSYFKTRRGEAKDEMKEERDKALKDVREALNRGLAKGQIKRRVIPGGNREEIVITLVPTTETQPDGILALVRIFGHYQRVPFGNGMDKPVSASRKRGGQFTSCHIHPVWAERPDSDNDHPSRNEIIGIWQLNTEKPLYFELSLKNGLTMTTYDKQDSVTKIGAGAPVTKAIKKPAASPADPPVKPGPVTPAAKKSNGNRVVVCGQCDTENTVKKTARTAKCGKCKAALDLTTN